MTTFVIDIDGTLCTQTASEYELARPILSRIARVNELYAQGHSIVIFTARGMKTSNGNRVAAEERWRLVTEKQLATWGLNYHKLLFGKPAGDFYIDDKTMEISEFFRE